MASIRPIGIHTPSALPYLISEGLLPPNPSQNVYTWETYRNDEEILYTDSCVVWSSGGLVRRVYKLDIEGEPIQQALLTCFHVADDTDALHDAEVSVEAHSSTEQSEYDAAKDQKVYGPHSKATQNILRSRALVVVLKELAHIYFMNGSSHTINLPFEVEKVFPAPSGLLVVRKTQRMDALYPTPQLPAAPFNSFLSPPSSQRPTPGFQSLSGQRTLPSRLKQPLSLGDFTIKPIKQTTDSLPRLFTLTDPLLEFGFVAEPNHNSPNRKAARNHKQSLEDLSAVNVEEDVLYISPENELREDDPTNDSCVILVLTFNRSQNVFTVWFASYTKSKPARSWSEKRDSESISSRLRRRSSYRSRQATGTNTPNLRQSVGGRESFGRVGQQPHASFRSSQNNAAGRVSGSFANDSSQKAENHLQHEDEWYNPDRADAANRRTSSMIARAELLANERNNFGDWARNRPVTRSARLSSSNVQYGSQNSNARNSLGTSRLSNGVSFSNQTNTQSSGFGQMSNDEIGSSLEEDRSEIFSDKERFDQDPFDPLKKELVMRKVFKIPSSQNWSSSQLNSSMPPPSPQYRVRTLASTISPSHHSCDIVHLLVLHPELHILTQIAVNVPAKQVVPLNGSKTQQQSTSTNIQCAIRQAENISDIDTVFDEKLERLLFTRLDENGKSVPSLCNNLDDLFDGRSHDLTGFDENDELPEQTGQMRAGTSNLLAQTHFNASHPISIMANEDDIPSNNSVSRIAHTGPVGEVDLLQDTGSLARFQIQLKPKDTDIARILDICRLMMSSLGLGNDELLPAWWSVYRSYSPKDQRVEWKSLATIIFAMYIRFVVLSKTTSSNANSTNGPLETNSLQQDSEVGEHRQTDLWSSMVITETSSNSNYASWTTNPAWKWLNLAEVKPVGEPRPPDTYNSSDNSGPPPHIKDSFVKDCVTKAREYVSYETSEDSSVRKLIAIFSSTSKQSLDALNRIFIALHILREELKLDTTSTAPKLLLPILAQIGSWLGWQQWGFGEDGYYSLDDQELQHFSFDSSTIRQPLATQAPPDPPSTYACLPLLLDGQNTTGLSIDGLLQMSDKNWTLWADQLRKPTGIQNALKTSFPRLRLVQSALGYNVDGSGPNATDTETSLRQLMDMSLLETLPEGIAAILRIRLAQCGMAADGLGASDPRSVLDGKPLIKGPRLLNTNIRALGARTAIAVPLHEFEPQTTLDMIYRDNERAEEALYILNPSSVSLAIFPPLPGVSESALLEAQRVHAQSVYMRTMTVTVGFEIFNYQQLRPIATEKVIITLFNTACKMQPSDLVIDADRSMFTEEKVSWAFFHAGAAAGLKMRRESSGINTSWLILNKPPELGNRHAGLLLGMGLNGHLKNMATWLIFKYLTPKHDMTSIGLLLGLSATHIGTMNSSITRLLSIHLVSLLPKDAAELNLSPQVQTAATMGIGLVYYNSQNRRMSEKMLAELENEDDDNGEGSVGFFHRDEGYKLATGFALGFINVGRGNDLRALHDVGVVERLLALINGPKRVDTVQVHDQASPGATIALALIFLKTQLTSVANRIEIPNTHKQFDFVRPDLLLLRVLAKKLIVWDDIQPSHMWIWRNIPQSMREGMGVDSVKDDRLPSGLDEMERPLNSKYVYIYNILGGLCWSISLKFAGKNNPKVRDILLSYYKFATACLSQAPINYDERLTRDSVARLQHLTLLAAATVMAGSGDLNVLRQCRILHAKIDQYSTFGYHQAVHMAMGMLFMGGGQYSFNTSNLAVASLICALYPIFPKEVLDNRAHLQAFRHLWVFASEARCLFIRDADNKEIIVTPVEVTLRDGSKQKITMPGLLPEISAISTVTTISPEYWLVELDFEHNPDHLEQFKRHRTIVMRRKSLLAQHVSPFNITLALQTSDFSPFPTVRKEDPNRPQAFDWLFKLPLFSSLQIGPAEIQSILPRQKTNGHFFEESDENESIHTLLDRRTTAIDDVLVLASGMHGENADRLENLKLLFDFVDKEGNVGRDLSWVEWIGRETLKALEAKVFEKMMALEEDEVENETLDTRSEGQGMNVD